MMGIVWLAIIGFLVGLVARALHPGQDNMGCFFTMALGIVGSVVAGFIGQQLGWYRIGQPAGFIASVFGAILVLVLLRSIGRR
ncbi:MAG: GlsB/YeaQ/YmgE family stress response membrane protein [Cardiobacteriaceae bacterium]|nr:GlsB/YeaQ/YmgE family stress response membrane protein [Cardiobacteriaceae bacterium]